MTLQIKTEFCQEFPRSQAIDSKNGLWGRDEAVFVVATAEKIGAGKADFIGFDTVRNGKVGEKTERYRLFAAMITLVAPLNLPILRKNKGFQAVTERIDGRIA